MIIIKIYKKEQRGDWINVLAYRGDDVIRSTDARSVTEARAIAREWAVYYGAPIEEIQRIYVNR